MEVVSPSEAVVPAERKPLDTPAGAPRRDNGEATAENPCFGQVNAFPILSEEGILMMSESLT